MVHKMFQQIQILSRQYLKQYFHLFHVTLGLKVPLEMKLRKINKQNKTKKRKRKGNKEIKRKNKIKKSN